MLAEFSVMISVLLLILACFYFMNDKFKEIQVATYATAMLKKFFTATLFPVLFLWMFEVDPTFMPFLGLVLMQIVSTCALGSFLFIANYLETISKSFHLLLQELQE